MDAFDRLLGTDPAAAERQRIEQRIAAHLLKVAVRVSELSDPEATRHRGESYSYARLITRLRELGEIGEALSDLQLERRDLWAAGPMP